MRIFASEITADNIKDDAVDRLLFDGLDYGGESGDLIMVLGSRKACEYRVPAAAKLFRDGKGDGLLFCGGKAQDTAYGFMPEFRSMVKAAEELGIPGEKIFTEQRSVSTAENFIFGGKMIEKQIPHCKKIILVTAAYHMRRAKLLAQKLLPQYEFIPCPVGCGSAQRDTWFKTEKGRKTALDECLKFGYYIEKGFIEDFEI